MIVEITDYGLGEVNFVEYSVFGLSGEQMSFLDENLDEKTCIVDDKLLIKAYFDENLYPFASDVAQFRLDDFIAREEIEMSVFLLSFLEDM